MQIDYIMIEVGCKNIAYLLWGKGLKITRQPCGLRSPFFPDAWSFALDNNVLWFASKVLEKSCVWQNWPYSKWLIGSRFPHLFGTKDVIYRHFWNNFDVYRRSGFHSYYSTRFWYVIHAWCSFLHHIWIEISNTKDRCIFIPSFKNVRVFICLYHLFKCPTDTYTIYVSMATQT